MNQVMQERIQSILKAVSRIQKYDKIDDDLQRFVNSDLVHIDERIWGIVDLLADVPGVKQKEKK